MFVCSQHLRLVYLFALAAFHQRASVSFLSLIKSCRLMVWIIVKEMMTQAQTSQARQATGERDRRRDIQQARQAACEIDGKRERQKEEFDRGSGRFLQESPSWSSG